MSEMREMGIDELFAVGDFEAFYRASEEKAAKKIGATRFAGFEKEDVIQEAMLLIHRGLPKYNPEKAKLSTFVDHIITNAIREMLSKAGTQKNLHLVNAKSFDAEIGFCEVGTYDYGYENTELVMDIMDSLNFSAQEKDVFRLRAGGYTLTEIATHLGVSPSRISQVWKNIAHKYQEDC